MYTLHLTCRTLDIDNLSAELWESGTAGVQEIDWENNSAFLIAGFETNEKRAALLRQFSAFSPQWEHTPETDWIKETQNAWPGRAIGERIFLAAPWCVEPTPPNRHQVIHNPGLACGTGEHPCTRLALEALEKTISAGCSMADVGAGSGILAIAALRLGAATAFAFDIDEQALAAARENSYLNDLALNIIAGSVDALAQASVDVAVANINATVLLSLADDLLPIVRPGGKLIVTGFPESESRQVAQLFPPCTVLHEDGWICFISICP